MGARFNRHEIVAKSEQTYRAIVFRAHARVGLAVSIVVDLVAHLWETGGDLDWHFALACAREDRIRRQATFLREVATTELRVVVEREKKDVK